MHLLLTPSRPPPPPQYAAWRRRPYWNWICKVAMLLSTVCAVGGLILIWVLYPKAYNYPQVRAGVGRRLLVCRGKQCGWVDGWVNLSARAGAG